MYFYQKTCLNLKHKIMSCVSRSKIYFWIFNGLRRFLTARIKSKYVYLVVVQPLDSARSNGETLVLKIRRTKSTQFFLERNSQFLLTNVCAYFIECFVLLREEFCIFITRRRLASCSNCFRYFQMSLDDSKK